jgi:hypothetical protein
MARSNAPADTSSMKRLPRSPMNCASAAAWISFHCPVFMNLPYTSAMGAPLGAGVRVPSVSTWIGSMVWRTEINRYRVSSPTWTG